MSKRSFAHVRCTFALGLLLGLASSACNQNDARAAADQPSQQTNPEQAPAAVKPAAQEQPTVDSQPALQSKPSYDEDAFTLTLTGPSAAKVGEPVKLLVTLSAKNGFKVNAEYPVKFRPVTAAGLLWAKETVGKDDGQVEKSKVVLPVELKLSQPGKFELAGKLSFSVCTEDRCLIEKRDLGVSITAS
ncbi:MAG TPA: hypothetical protein VN764_11660 [Polyangiaceae bacterium]|nr:hypothetical protein [Polyangiaceae bacterium]